MKNVIFYLLSSLALAAHAGYGNMGIAESDGDVGSAAGGVLLAGVVIGGTAGWLYAYYKNKSGGTQIAPDGAAIIGGLIGAVVVPLLYILS